MKKIISFLLILCVTNLYAQDFKTEFLKHFKSGDTESQFRLLEEWESKKPNDPELFVSYFNYYFVKSGEEIITLGAEKPIDGDYLSLSDSLENQVGYIGSEIRYNPNDFKKSIEWIDRGIKAYPDRLDMRFGKIYVLKETENWKEFSEEIIKSIQHSAKIQNKWLWTDDENNEMTDHDFLLFIQNYQIDLFNTENDDLLIFVRNIAEEALKYYPESVENLTNMAISYLFVDEFDNALPYLLKAEKIDPKDIIVLGNIGHTYFLMNEKQKSIEYYQKIIQHGNEEDVEFAKQKIQELKIDF